MAVGCFYDKIDKYLVNNEERIVRIVAFSNHPPRAKRALANLE